MKNFICFLVFTCSRKRMVLNSLKSTRHQKAGFNKAKDDLKILSISTKQLYMIKIQHNSLFMFMVNNSFTLFS